VHEEAGQMEHAVGAAAAHGDILRQVGQQIRLLAQVDQPRDQLGPVACRALAALLPLRRRQKQRQPVGARLWVLD
jgi:hypothetical protein